MEQIVLALLVGVALGAGSMRHYMNVQFQHQQEIDMLWRSIHELQRKEE